MSLGNKKYKSKYEKWTFLVCFEAGRKEVQKTGRGEVRGLSRHSVSLINLKKKKSAFQECRSPGAHNEC